MEDTIAQLSAALVPLHKNNRLRRTTMIFEGRNQIPYAYGCYGYTCGGKMWHCGRDSVSNIDMDVSMFSKSCRRYGTWIPTVAEIFAVSRKIWSMVT